MFLASENRDVSSSGVMQVARATIKATPKIFSFFADMTYANKPIAICRELVSNAMDAHVMAGHRDPVEVWLPNGIDPQFRVKDHGVGMAHDFVMGPFMAYTDGSTKDQSNDQIGGFGIGSKSPFAYVDQFTLRVVHDHILSIYSMFKDSDGIPSIGLLAQSSTDESNGVEVSFPVEAKDFELFENAALSALQFFNPLPIIHNSDGLTPPHYLAQGSNWGMRKDSGDLAVIMGGVRYPVTTSNLSYELRYDATVKNLLTFGLDLTLPIGAASVALSREALSYDDRTSENIQAALTAVVDEVTESFATMFDDNPSLWDAQVHLATETVNDYSGRGKFLAERAYYRGQKFEKSIRFENSGIEVWNIEPAHNRHSRRSHNLKPPTSKWEFARYITPGDVETVIIDDLPQKPKSKTPGRIRLFVETHPNNKKVVAFRSDLKSTSEILETLGNPSDYILTSSLPVPEVVRYSRKNPDRPKVRMFTMDGTENLRRIHPDHSYCVEEIAYADQPATGILVVLNNFEPPARFYDKMSSGLIYRDEIHFVNQSDAHKLKNWLTFDQVFDDRLKLALAEYAELPQRLALSNDRDLIDCFEFIVENSITAAKGVFGKIVALHQRYVEPISPQQRLLAPFVTPTLPKGVKPAGLLAQFKAKQPLAYRMIQISDRITFTPEDIQIFNKVL